LSINELDEVGRVLDFSVIKTLLCEWLEENYDHKFLLWEKDPLLASMKELDPTGIISVPFNPTAENIAKHLVEVIGPKQLKGTSAILSKCRVEETRKCAASYELKSI
jgi:6-pyruvoyltetrahydropterin/6-carboxytetrahydropterin synthase